MRVESKQLLADVVDKLDDLSISQLTEVISSATAIQKAKARAQVRDFARSLAEKGCPECGDTIWLASKGAYCVCGWKHRNEEFEVAVLRAVNDLVREVWNE